MKKLIYLVAALILLVPHAAHAEYKYAYAEAEYLVTLPDAPTGETIWAQDGHVPYIDKPPKYGAVGEIARLKRMDPDTGDIFEVKITFVKADREFLVGLTEDSIKDTLQKELADVHLQNAKFNMSKGVDTLKWGTYSGFSVSQNNDILYNIAHYLVGLNSVMVVKVAYNVQNAQFNEYYKALSKSITYMGR